jgi:thiosulfate/3-mercaptopyruvate sulfurtransferase
MSSRRAGALAPFVVIALALPAFADVAAPSPLVDAGWLFAHLNEVQVVDVRDDVGTYAEAPRFVRDAATGERRLAAVGGHIPGAKLVDFGHIREPQVIEGVKLPAMMPTRAGFEKTMAAAGVGAGRTLVIVSPGDSVGSMEMATRLYFQLKYFGQDQIAVLNGGVAAWLQAGFPYQTGAADRRRGDWSAGAERSAILATTADVKEAVATRATQIVDARPLAQFYGLARSPVVAAAGHVAGARAFPTESRMAMRGVSAQFLTPAQYRGVFETQGIDPAKPSISYCNTGHFGSGAWFVQSELLKQPGARLYAGSMNEWTNLRNPVVGLPQ